jgi:hypothetical protein
MMGPPGTGKTLLARALPGILPKMSFDESLDVTRIYSVADQLPPETLLLRNRPFRSPHHTISHAGLVGGGNWPHPGETLQEIAAGLGLAGASRRTVPGRTAGVRDPVREPGLLCACPVLVPGLPRWKCCASRSKTKWSPSAGRRAR